MLFRLSATVITEGLINDPYFANDPEFMPGDFAILYKDAKKYRDGKDFKVRKLTGGKSETVEVEYNAEIISIFNTYYSIWEDFHYFGLQGGGGSSKELPWYLDFIKQFERVYQEITWYRQQKARQ